METLGRICAEHYHVPSMALWVEIWVLGVLLLTNTGHGGHFENGIVEVGGAREGGKVGDEGSGHVGEDESGEPSVFPVSQGFWVGRLRKR